MDLINNGLELPIINGSGNGHSKDDIVRAADRYPRRKSRQVMIGGIPIGGGAPVSVQTMSKTKTSDIEATVAQIKRCEEAGVDIVRVTVNNKEASEAIGEIVRRVNVPIVADIHFNYMFALKAIEAGVAKVRINPGNIGKVERIQKVLSAAKERNIPIRIGVNSGSLEKEILDKHGYPTAEALFESAMKHVQISQEFGFEDLIISVKSTSVPLMIEAYRLIAERTDFPLHLGVTEAGRIRVGTIKSAVGIGTLLAEGIGDTIRVSLTDEPEREVEVGKEILRTLGYAQRNVEIISCPTCGRLDVDLFKITEQIEDAVKDIKKPMTVSILGCAVNGPGEAREADLGVAAAKGKGLLFRKGVPLRYVPEEDIVTELLKEIHAFVPES
ncbi:MAG: flavodoxin-dependent (E)-4-hydroxy-3-methylbut-2-enyl-diphosphate synthase [Candidatus Kapabacteria bacterium]|nr:flavodoxin-dependent (E)-4-hydroxy-3-methylbut-2-enyl-diphosphate synthase [Ignavibacteriota bacterium]MCW5884454.1 flavodoxin-dependent (E)-4-hydroxy-3-methylbut-2-enyl-diphosphate synthase [Candidatus Kapabacteria bacterium]